MATYGPSSYGNVGGWEQSKQQNQQDSSFLGGWASRDLLWTARLGAGEAFDRYLGTAKDTFRASDAYQYEDLGFTVSDSEDKPTTKAMTYGSLLKLNDGSVAWKDLSWSTYKAQVRKNTYLLKEATTSVKLVIRPNGSLIVDSKWTVGSYVISVTRPAARL